MAYGPDQFPRLIRRRHCRVRPPRQRRPTVTRMAAYRGRRHAEFRGKYRVFNAAEYRLYRSNSGPPVESDTPFGASSSLPTTPANTYADGTWYLSLSWFNGVFDSGFLPIGPRGETYLRLDLSGGAETLEPPAAPSTWRIDQTAGVVRVSGLYAQAGSLRAEDWAIGYTVDGSTPAADTPTVTQAIAADLDALVYDLPVQSHGTTIKVRLQTRRNDGSWVYSEGSTVETLVIDTTGPTAPRAGDRWSGRLPEAL